MFCPALFFYRENTPRSRPRRERARNQNGFVPDNFDFPPRDDHVVLVTEQSEAFRSPVNHQCGELGTARVYLHVIHATETASVADIDDLFIV